MFCILHHNIVYLCFLNTASSLFLWHNLVHFGILLSTPAIKTFRREWQSNHGQFLLIKNLDPVRKDFYRQHACNYLLLLNNVYIKWLCIFCKWLRVLCWLHILWHCQWHFHSVTVTWYHTMQVVQQLTLAVLKTHWYYIGSLLCRDIQKVTDGALI